MTTELDHMEVTGELNKDCILDKVGVKPQCCGDVGRKGEVETASMNNAKEKREGEGTLRNEAMGGR